MLLAISLCRSSRKVYGIGKIRLFNQRTREFPVGIVVDLVKYLKENEYEFTIAKEIAPIDLSSECQKFIDEKVPLLKQSPRDFQMRSFMESLRYNRSLTISATGSGKSQMIYMLVRFFLDYLPGKILISVPSINLIRQMKNDFNEYEENNPVSEESYELYSGQSKISSKRVIITTLAMLRNMKKEFFQDFGVYICDESHQADTQSVAYIINHIPHVPFRFGFTGTLDGTKIHELQCRAWFGKLVKVSSTADLIERGVLSQLKMDVVSLEYPEDERLIVSKLDYQDEIKYIVSHNRRNDWLIKTALTQKNNTLVLFNFVEKHGEKLLKMAQEQAEAYRKRSSFYCRFTEKKKLM